MIPVPRDRTAAVSLLLLLAGVLGAGCYDRNALVEPSEILTLEASPTAIPADGFSTTQLIVQLNPRADRVLQVAFKATRGTLTSSQVSVDSAGRAVAVLQSDTRPGSVVVTADIKRGEVIEASRSINVTFDTVASGSVIRIFISNSTLPADGASQVQLRAELNQGVTNRAVTFQTTSGSFSAQDENLRSTSVTAADDGVARALLHAPRALGSALVTATAGGFSATETMTFLPALPDALALRVSPLQLDASDTSSASITATLSRTVGRVTVNTVVDFSAVEDATGGPFGTFVNVRRSNTDEQATAEFIAGSGASPGLATITARVPGTALSRQVKIQIN